MNRLVRALHSLVPLRKGELAIVNICLTIGWLFIARRTGQLYDARASHLPEGL